MMRDGFVTVCCQNGENKQKRSRFINPEDVASITELNICDWQNKDP